MSENKNKQCPQFPFFGARYNDACCIDGVLYDLDSDNGEGQLTSGGDVPCMFCDPEGFKEYNYFDFEPEEMENYLTKMKERYE